MTFVRPGGKAGGKEGKREGGQVADAEPATVAPPKISDLLPVAPLISRTISPIEISCYLSCLGYSIGAGDS